MYYTVSSGEISSGIILNGNRMFISSGGTANSTTVNSNGSMYISSGGVANSTTINSGGDMDIYSGGTANSTTINYYGEMYISSGGTATNIIENGGYVYVANGAYATFTSNTIEGVVLSYTNMTVHKNTIANSTTINHWGSMYISSGGVANSTTVNSGGDMTIDSGGVANSTTIKSGGDMFIVSGGVANSTTINGGAMSIYSGGIATEIVENGGYVDVQDGAYATFASNTIEGVVLSNASMTVHKNTIANSTTVNLWGSMHISSGGVANSTTVNSNGSMRIHSGGVANSTTINSRGTMYIYSGGMANSTTIKSGGSITISSGGSASSTTINSGGYMYIYSGGVANSTTVNNRGYMTIFSGGTANSTTINSRGTMYIYFGGTATNIVENGGYVDVADGAFATFASNTIEGVVLSNANMTVHKNTIANSTTISGGYMYISSGGVANSTTVNSRGYMRISSGGVANSTMVNSGGYMYISSGGVATNVIWTPCIGHVNAADGAYVTYTSQYSGVYFGSNNTLLSHAVELNEKVVSGSMYIFSGGTANSTTVNDGGDMYIYSGGVANSTTVNDGYMYISSGGTAKDIIVMSDGRLGLTVAPGTYIQGTSNGSAFEMKDAFISAYTVNSGGDMTIYSGGSASSTTINSGGDMDIYSGGVANSTTINSGGHMDIYSGGTATNIVENGGYVDVADGAFATFASNTIEGFVLSGIGANMTVHKNTIANSTTVNDGSMRIHSGGTANDTTINSGGDMNIWSGGVANSTTINYWGEMYISSGGVANSTTVNGGDMDIYSGGVANSTTINSGGDMDISSDGTANSTTIKSGGHMDIYSGGTANDTTINSGGYMWIYPGGTHRGCLQLEAGAVITAYTGGIIDFTVADRTSADDYLINNLSRIYGALTYTITVSADQEAGTYKLAQGTAALEGSITICTTDTCFGELTINGDTLTFDGVTYDLNNVDGNLTLTITKPEYVIGNFNGVFEFTPDGSGTLYTPAGKQEIAGTIDAAQWELVGAGDFNKSGTDGLLWIEKETGYVYVQNDLTNFDEVKNKANCLGVLGDEYSILNTGDFTGTGISGVLMQGPAFGDESISLNYGLPIWGREADGTTFAGWLGALVNTWQPGDALKGDTSDLADINAKNYMYEVVSVGDYNGDGVDDVMLQNIMPKTVDGVTITGSGDVFTFLTGDMAAVKAGASPTVAYTGCATDGWEIIGSGDFDGDGIDDVLLSDGTGVTAWKMVNGQRSADLWFGNLRENKEISGITDLNNDGTDDILVLNTATDTYSGWLVKDGVITGSLAIA